MLHDRVAIPARRSDNVIVKELADEVLVYDLARSRAFCLNPTSAAAWKACDGIGTFADVARAVEAAVGVADGDVVWLALRQLSDDGLLVERVQLPPAQESIGRRELMTRLGTGAAAAIPFVVAMAAPRAAKAYMPTTYAQK